MDILCNISRFFAENRKSDGSDMRVILAAQDSHLKHNDICENSHMRRTDNSSSADRSGREKQELFAKKATEHDQM